MKQLYNRSVAGFTEIPIHCIFVELVASLDVASLQTLGTVKKALVVPYNPDQQTGF